MERKIKKFLAEYKLKNKKRFTVEELENYLISSYRGNTRYSTNCGYGELYNQISNFKGNNQIREIKSYKYNGLNPPLKTRWEAINKGEGDLPEGSGGQTLSVNTFVIMMIMNFRKKNIGNENPWTVLILDNPFGKASARHVLDPIFEIANKLNFQLICFAAPEIIKVEISERFPVFWELKVEDGKVVHGGRVIKQ